MAEYRTFFISLQLLVNICFPLIDFCLKPAILLTYFLTVIFISVVLLYIYIKKRLYFKKYLCRTYIPSIKLIIITESTNLVLIFLLYFIIYMDNPIIDYTIGFKIMHLILSVIVYSLLLFQKEKNRAIIAYTRHEYKLGIVAKDIGGKNGLKKGQPVEIIREIPGGYIVRDSSKHEFEIKTEDIESTIDVI